MIIQCHECGRNVSTEATACMSCGAPPRISGRTNQQSPQTEITYTNFRQATYRTTCTACLNPYLIKGRSLRIKDHIKCPNPECGKRTQTEKLKITHDPKEVVIYKIIGDYFSYDGRISVAQYWLSMIMAFSIIFGFLLLIFEFGGSLRILKMNDLITCIYFLAFILIHPLWIKRYHDLGLRSEWVLFHLLLFLFVLNPSRPSSLDMMNSSEGKYLAVFLFIILMTNLVLGAIIAFVPGQNKPNRYGPPINLNRTKWT